MQTQLLDINYKECFQLERLLDCIAICFKIGNLLFCQGVKELFICETLEETKCYDVHPELFEEEEKLVHIEIKWTNF